MKLRINNRISYFVIVFLFFNSLIIAQEVENDFQTRTSASLSFKPVKKLKVYFTPELRYDQSFSLDKYLFETGVEYKPFKIISFETAYRYIVNPRDNKDAEYFHRYDFSATVKKDFERFEPAFRLRYSNYADDEASKDDYFRYKAALAYDIAKTSLKPTIGMEAFQQLSDQSLYKIRYSLGFGYKLFKDNYVGLSYKLDYYMNEYKNRHILGISYKIKL